MKYKQIILYYLCENRKQENNFKGNFVFSIKHKTSVQTKK